MKYSVPAMVMVALLLLFWRPYPSPEETLPIHQGLRPGETNPPLRRVAHHWPLQKGTELWFTPTNRSYGQILEVREDTALVLWKVGGSNWLNRTALDRSWMVDN